MKNPPIPLGDPRRATERSRESLLVSYTISADLAAEYTETYDIALGGLAMLTNAALTAEQDIIIELELRDDHRPTLKLNGNVRWSTYDALLGKYRTGVAFSEPSSAFKTELLRYIDILKQLRDVRVP